MHSTVRITVVWSQESSDGVVTTLQAGCPRNCASIPNIEKRVSSSTVPRLALAHTQSPIPWAYWILPEVQRGQCNMPPWQANGQHYPYLKNIVAMVAISPHSSHLPKQICCHHPWKIIINSSFMSCPQDGCCAVYIGWWWGPNFTTLHTGMLLILYIERSIYPL